MCAVVAHVAGIPTASSRVWTSSCGPRCVMAVRGLAVAADDVVAERGEGVALDGTTLYLSSEGRMWNRPGRLLSLQCALEHE